VTVAEGFAGASAMQAFLQKLETAMAKHPLWANSSVQDLDAGMEVRSVTQPHAMNPHRVRVSELWMSGITSPHTALSSRLGRAAVYRFVHQHMW